MKSINIFIIILCIIMIICLIIYILSRTRKDNFIELQSQSSKIKNNKWLNNKFYSKIEKNTLSEEQIPLGAFEHPLSTENPEYLPADVKNKGLDMLNKCADIAKKMFNSDELIVNSPYITKIFDLFEFTSDITDPVINDLGSKTVYSYIDEISSVISKNPITIVALSEIINDDYLSSLVITDSQKDQIKFSIIYSSFLNSISLVIMYSLDTTLLQSIVDLFQTQRDKYNWRQYFTTFELLKIFSVSIQGNIDSKNDPDGFFGSSPIFGKYPIGRPIMQVNITEAMYADTLLFYDDNPYAGYAMNLSCQSQDYNPVTGVEPSKIGPYNTYLLFNDFSDSWANLYVSWNMNFVFGQFGSVFDYFSKLVCPSVGSLYHEIPGIFVYNRVTTLYIQLQYVLLSYVKSENRIYYDNNFTNTEMIRKWGYVNKQAGQSYINRLESAMNISSNEAKQFYERNKYNYSNLWNMLRNSTILARNVLPEQSQQGDGETPIGGLCYGRNAACKSGNVCSSYDDGDYRCCKNTILGLNKYWLPSYFCSELPENTQCYLSRQCISGNCENGKCTGGCAVMSYFNSKNEEQCKNTGCNFYPHWYGDNCCKGEEITDSFGFKKCKK